MGGEGDESYYVMCNIGYALVVEKCRIFSKIKLRFEF